MTSLELNLKSKNEWIEVFPFGIAMGVGQPRPVMIFKDKEQNRVLPVWISPIDAGIAVSQGGTTYSVGEPMETSPHEIAWEVLHKLDIHLDRCLFRKINGQEQYVELIFVKIKDGKKSTKPVMRMEAKADSAISFCLRSGCQFYATIDYMEKSRVMEGKVLLSGWSASVEANPHPYLN